MKCQRSLATRAFHDSDEEPDYLQLSALPPASLSTYPPTYPSLALPAEPPDPSSWPAPIYRVKGEESAAKKRPREEVEEAESKTEKILKADQKVEEAEEEVKKKEAEYEKAKQELEEFEAKCAAKKHKKGKDAEVRGEEVSRPFVMPMDRPMSAFMLFAKARKQALREEMLREGADADAASDVLALGRQLGEEWRALSFELRSKWEKRSQEQLDRLRNGDGA
tara:strand:+ start:290 stop:955 length:666 start_codon:yes stop_codon:yes gene_type:complete